jgi:hypothetical protein
VGGAGRGGSFRPPARSCRRSPEGAISWTLARNLFTLRRTAKIVGIMLREMTEAIRVEHCDTLVAVDSAIKKFFRVDERGLRPFNFGRAHLNFISCSRLSSI